MKKKQRTPKAYAVHFRCHRCHCQIPIEKVCNHFGLKLCRECAKHQAQFVQTGREQKTW